MIPNRENGKKLTKKPFRGERTINCTVNKEQTRQTFSLKQSLKQVAIPAFLILLGYEMSKSAKEARV